jgi:hypothetical protein
MEGKMSSINNSYEYYQSNQGLLSMLNKNKTGNPLINQLIEKNELEYQQKMEAFGIHSAKGNNKYKSVETSANNLEDALIKLGKDELYKAEQGKEYDNSTLIKNINNYVAAYNSAISALDNCGGSLKNSFKTDLIEAFKEKTEALNSIGFSLSADGKLYVDQEKLKVAKPEDVQKIFNKESEYYKSILNSASAMDTIINKALAMKSGTYNARGIML